MGQLQLAEAMENSEETGHAKDARPQKHEEDQLRPSFLSDSTPL